MAVNINLGLTANAAGTVDIITATYAPAVTALTDRLVLIFRATGANTSTTPTFSPNGLTAHTIVRHGGQALRAGDIPAARFEAIVMYDLANTRWELLNPALGNGDVFWKAGAGLSSLMDKRSTTGSGQEGFTAGVIAENSGDGGQAIGAGAINSGLEGQAIGNLANNSIEAGQALGKSANNSGGSGQAIGVNANNSGFGGQAIGDNSINSGEEGQAIGETSVNAYARSSAIGHQSVSTADDQMNLAQTLRLQAYTGASARNLTIGTDGIVSASTGIVREIWIPSASMTPRATNGAAASSEEYATNDINLDYYLFDGTTEEAVQFTLSLPQAWNAGTVKVKLYWDAATGASAADGVVWGVRAGSLANDEAIDAALGTEIEVTDAVLAVGDMHVTAATAAITIGGTPAVDDFLILQVARKVGNASDNMTEDAKLFGIKLQYTESANLPTAW